jgi:hypothetical protein
VAPLLLFVRTMKRNDEMDQANGAGPQKDPDEWKTGGEPMTAAQRSYLETLSRDTGEPVDERLSKAEASKLIDRLRERSPRVQGE